MTTVYLTTEHTKPPSRIRYGAGLVSTQIMIQRNRLDVLAENGIVRHVTPEVNAPLGYSDWVAKTDEYGDYYEREPIGDDEQQRIAERNAAHRAAVYQLDEEIAAQSSDLAVNVARAAHLREKPGKSQTEQQVLRELDDKFKRLHEALQDKEQLEQGDFRGDWDGSTPYASGQFVRHNGAVWVAEDDVSSYPPDDVPGGWRRLGGRNA